MINFDLSRNFLDLVTSYCKLMILMGRVEDRKVIVGLFNAAYEMQNGQS